MQKLLLQQLRKNLLGTMQSVFMYSGVVDAKQSATILKKIMDCVIAEHAPHNQHPDAVHQFRSQQPVLMSSMHNNFLNHAQNIQQRLMSPDLKQFNDKYANINCNVMLQPSINQGISTLFYGGDGPLGRNIQTGCHDYLMSHTRPEGITLTNYKPYEVALIRPSTYKPPGYPKHIIGEDTYLIHNSQKPEHTLNILALQLLLRGQDKNGTCAGQDGICSYSDPDGERIFKYLYHIAINKQTTPFVIFKAPANKMVNFKVNEFLDGSGGICLAESAKIDPIMSYTPTTGMVIHDMQAFAALCLPATAVPEILYKKNLATIVTEILTQGIPFLDNKTGKPLTLEEAADLLHAKPEKFVECIVHTVKKINEHNIKHNKDIIDINNVKKYCTNILEKLSHIKIMNTYITAIMQQASSSKDVKQELMDLKLQNTQEPQPPNPSPTG